MQNSKFFNFTLKPNISRKPRLKKVTFHTLGQSIFLTSNFFVKNDLLSYASGCAFGFLFSFIPIVILILVVLLRIFHTSPASLSILVAGNTDFLSRIINLDSLSQAIINVNHITLFEIVTAVAIIMMARRFFTNVVNSITCIFKTEAKTQGWFKQIIIFAGEAILIIFISLLITFVYALKNIQILPFFAELRSHFPILASTFSKLAVQIVPIAVEFAAVFLIFKFGSRTRPPLIHTLIASGSCTLSFWAFQKLMTLFINMNRYNLVYGILSNVVVLLLEVWFFFVIFLFCAEFLFVSQFFDTLLLSELYLLPNRDSTKFKDGFKRMIFIKPDSLSLNKENLIELKKDQYIYTENEKGSDVYYILEGTVELFKKNNISYADIGDFFGENSCMLNEVRLETAKAASEKVKIIKISQDQFFEVLRKNPSVSLKALSQISSYFSKFYN